MQQRMPTKQILTWPFSKRNIWNAKEDNLILLCLFDLKLDFLKNGLGFYYNNTMDKIFFTDPKITVSVVIYDTICFKLY